jgi:hypothetical protein
MTLPTGTALHHGHYVVDAFSAEDAIGPIYLATSIPRGRWVQLRILGSRRPEAIPLPEERKAFYNYLLTVQALNHPLFAGHLSGFEDGGVCYQVIDANLGNPLSRFVSAHDPVPPRHSIALVRQVAHGLLALKPLGWQGITLTPDQLWQRPQQSSLTFTGFDFPPPEPSPEQHQEALVVRGLTYLLYFLLTGNRAEGIQTPLAVDVRQRRPGLPYTLDTALQLGSRQDLQQPSVGLQQWIDLLPASAALPEVWADLPRQPEGHPSSHLFQGPKGTVRSSGVPQQAVATLSTPVAAAAVTPRSVQTAGSKVRALAPVALVLTALGASVGGLGLGLTARLHPPDASGPVRLNPEQSFPPLSDWSGDDPVEAWEYSPTRRSLPDYGEVAPPPAVVIPDPVTSPVVPTVSELDPLPDNDLSDDMGLEFGSPTEEFGSPVEAEGFFFADPEPFTAEPDTAPSLPAPVSSPGDIASPAPSGDPGIKPADPVRPAPGPVVPVPPTLAAPKPLTPPPPPLDLPPSAPAPSTNQGGAPPTLESGAIPGSAPELAETSGSTTL